MAWGNKQPSQPAAPRALVEIITGNRTFRVGIVGQFDAQIDVPSMMSRGEIQWLTDLISGQKIVVNWSQVAVAHVVEGQ